MKRYFAAKMILGLLMIWHPAAGQQLIGMSYNMGFSQGEFRTQTGMNSYIGFGVEGRQFYAPELAFGVSFNWNKFQSGSSSAYLREGERNIDVFPLLLNLSYFLFDETTKFRPAVGLNAGTYFINDRFFSEQGLEQQKNWHIGFAPEAAVATRLVDDLYLLILLRYNYALGSGGSQNYQYIGLHLTFCSISIL